MPDSRAPGIESKSAPSVQRLLWSFVRPYAWLSSLALALLGALVFLDLAIPRLIQRVIDQGIAQHDSSVVAHSALLMLAISAVSVLLAIANNIVSVKVGEGVARDIREAIFIKIQGYSFSRLNQQKTGELLVRLTSDVNAIKFLTLISLRIGTRAPLLMLGSLVLMIDTSQQLATMLLPLLLVTVVLIIFFIINMEPLYLSVQRKLDEVNDVIHENVAGARLIKGLVRGEYECQRFEKVNEEMTRRSIRVMRLMSWMSPSLAMCINLGVVLVIWRGGHQSISAKLSLGQIVAFSNYLMTTMTPLVMMTMLSNTWAAGFASLRRVRTVLKDWPPDSLPTLSSQISSETNPQLVKFEKVGFHYNTQPQEQQAEPIEAEQSQTQTGVGPEHGVQGSALVLNEVSFEANEGQTVAILGSTGAGKSTLINLIAGFYTPTFGHLHLFGRDVRSWETSKLLSRIGLVPQESVLFSGSLRDNIRYGRPQASQEQVEQAAKAAQIHDFITSLPEGYDSRVEQRGNNFSGGQKQRIAIARALLIEPELLILDDSTSAVDGETEAKIKQALTTRKGLRTTIVVAQRATTILDADLILVLDKGVIAASGTHSELLQSSPIYREICDSQLGAGQ